MARADSHELQNIEDLWQENAFPSGNNMMYYINEQLLLYLEECIEKSVDRYQCEGKNWKLRNTIETVSNFEDVGNVFSTICGELKGYKDKIFKLSTYEPIL